MDELRLNSFLRFGYFLDYSDSRYTFDLTGVDRDRYGGADEEELIALGIEKTRHAITRQFTPGTDTAVPLSGGLDSRAILAALMECTEAARIDTYTFGSPGTMDYEIGNRVAAALGTRHTPIPLDRYVFSQAELLETSHRIDHQTVLFSTAPLSVLAREFPDHIHWSGAFAGTPTGNVLPTEPSRSPAEAKQRFIDHKYTHVKSVRLIPWGDEVLHPLLDMHWLDPATITYDEQLHVEFAQQRWIAPHVLMRGFHYRTPFLDPEWLGFMFGVEDRYRSGQYLYREILRRAFPVAFAYPTKSNLGAPLGAGRVRLAARRLSRYVGRAVGRRRRAWVDPGVNYIDFNDGIRERSDLRDIVHRNVMDLRGRGMVDWLDLESLWKRHMNRAANHGDALLVLASLEIHLQALERGGRG